MKTKFWLLFFSVLCVILAVLSVVLLYGGEGAEYAEVYSDGKLVVRLDLSEDTEYRVAFGEDWNLLTVRSGKIAVTAASCTSQDCVRHPPSDHGAPIVCLPNRLVIEFTISSDYDALIG